jgi:predicted PolB exonuclease-like 3'-5' exonuclease
MLDQLKIEDILFLDIETVPVTYKYAELNDNTRKLWDNKFRFQTADTPDNIYKKAGVYAEFAKIICISVGFMADKNFRLKSFYGDSEKILLAEFAELLNKHFNKKESLLCAHNGKEFDYPFIARRMLVNGIKLPKILNIAGKKPWEVNLLDTMELWKFGDYKNFTSLNLLAHIFDIPTPKDDIDGSDVSRVYYEEKNIERIATYCQKDVLTVAQLLLRFKGEPLIKPEQVVIT